MTTKNMWWRLEKDAHTSLIPLIKNLQAKNKSVDSLHASYASQYLNRNIADLMKPQQGKRGIDHTALRYNVIRSCIDSACSKISKNKARVQFLTTGGDYKQQKNAQKLTQYLDGVFANIKLYETAQEVFRDACIFGIGILKTASDGQQVVCERVLPTEILVNEQESLYGKPRNLYQTKIVDRYVLLEMFPDFEEQILRAPIVSMSEDAERIEVHEAWHLGKSGRHVIAIAGCDLLNEVREKDYFPFVFCRWSQQVIGFHGVGIAEELMGIQLEINEILQKIQKSLDLVVVPRVYVETNSKIELQQLTNDIGAVVEYSGNMPTFTTPQALPSEVYAHLDRLFEKAYEIIGMSQLSASAKKPSGLDAAVALREFQDIESERFSLVSQRWEAMFVEIAQQIIDVTKELVEAGVKPKVKVARSRFVSEIKWKELNWDDDAFVLQPFASSLLPTSPAGRLQKVIELMDRGILSEAEGKRLLDFPDLQSASLNSGYEDAMATIEAALEEGIYETPEPGQDLETLVKLGTSKYLEARRSKYPQDRLEILRKIIEDSKALIQEQQPAPQEEGQPQQ